MSSIATASLVFVCVFIAALLGLFLRAALPQHHLSTETKDSVKLAMGLVATMAALILGLLVAAAKESYDTKKNETIQIAAKIAFLDRALAHYGPDASGPRALLHSTVDRVIARMWPEIKATETQLDPSASGGEGLYEAILNLSPQNDAQRALKSQALSGASDIAQMRWLLYEQSGTSISVPLLVVVVAWLAIIFLSFGLFAPSNATVIVALMVAAISVSGAILLILELDRPFDGLIHISSNPMRIMQSHLGR